MHRASSKRHSDLRNQQMPQFDCKSGGKSDDLGAKNCSQKGTSEERKDSNESVGAKNTKLPIATNKNVFNEPSTAAQQQIGTFANIKPCVSDGDIQATVIETSPRRDSCQILIRVNDSDSTQEHAITFDDSSHVNQRTSEILEKQN